MSFFFFFILCSLWDHSKCKGWYTKSKPWETNWLLSLGTLNLSVRRKCQDNFYVFAALATEAICLPLLNMHFILYFNSQTLLRLQNKNQIIWLIPFFTWIRNKIVSLLGADKITWPICLGWPFKCIIIQFYIPSELFLKRNWVVSFYCRAPHLLRSWYLIFQYWHLTLGNLQW